jgi:two-component system, NtrC family, sensor histidine kinase HydH
MVEDKTRSLLALESEKSNLEKLAAVGQTATVIVHEVRNPLATIEVGVTALLSRSTFNEPDRKCLEVMAQAIDRLNLILKDLLNFGKPAKFHRIPQDLHVVISQAVEQMSKHFESKRIRVHYALMENPSVCAIDSDRFLQVFANLFMNAIQAMPDGGILFIQTQPCEGGKIRIGISDTGVGIKEEDRSRIFDPFFTTKSGGTGLGLALVNSVVKGHDGTVRVHSHLGEGSRIEIEIPMDFDPNRPDIKVGHTLSKMG